MTRTLPPFLSRSIFLFAAFLLLSADASGQYFGRNKVQWERFDFKVLRTPHFDIYYYDESAPVIEDVGRVAERWYERLSVVFNHEFARKPIVLYANHPDFQQTTTTGGFIGEGTGGFTDSIQNRIVMPLTASFAETDHIIGHEMVHVFQYDISNSQGQRPGQQRFRLEQLPLWMIEGLAEYLSQGREDPQTAMWMRDATLNDLLPDLRELSRDPRLSPYQYGQAFWAYIGGRYGDGRVIDLFLASGLYGIEPAFVRVLGISAEQAFADWHAATRLQYEPVVLRSWPEARLGSPVITDSVGARTINVAPAVSPDGRWVAFLSSRELFSIGLFLADTSTGEVVATLASAAANPHIDALRFIDSSGAWSPDGEKFAFVVFERGDNRLAIVDVASRRIERRIKVPGVEGLANPAWSPDGRTIALSGQARGVTDIFLYDIESEQVRQLTNDRYTDIHPAWSPDGRTIAFASDRGPETDFTRLHYGKLKIATVDAASGRVSVLSLLGNARHSNPQYSPDGESIFFIADPEGSADIFRYDAAGGVRRITNVVSGVSGIVEMSPALSVASRSGQIYYSLFHKAKFDIYTVASGDLAGEPVTARLADATAPAGILPPPSPTQQSTVASYLDRPVAGLPPPTMEFARRDYSSALRLTYVGPPTIGIGADSQGASAYGGSVSAYFSDVLGIHNVGVSVQGGSSSTSIGSAIGAEVVYLNRGQRVHYGAAASHIPYVSAFTTVSRDTVIVDGQEFVADVFQQRREIVTVDQLQLLSQYPFGLTRRVELNGGYLRYGFDAEIEQIIAVGNQIIDRQTFDLDAPEALNLYQGSAAFVGDSSYFGFVSPIRGTRYRYEAGAVTGDLDYQTGLADWRRYFFRRPVTFAVRGLFFGRFGDDAESGRLRPLFIGNSALVRGYESNSFNPEVECSPTPSGTGCPEFERLVGSRIGVAGLELRVPLFGTDEFGLINMPFLPTELVGFLDGGAAWTKDESADFTYETDTTERVPVFSAGIAARILLGGYIPIELYYAYPFQRPEENGVFGFAINTGW